MTTPPTAHPFRFGVVTTHAPTGTAWLDTARHLEALGYDALLTPDSTAHGLAALPLLAAAAAVTTRLHLGTYVLANDLHHPVHVAQDAATLAHLSGGRFELGIGAGHGGTGPDNAVLGQPFDPAAVRVSRLTQALDIIHRLLDGQTVTTHGPRYTITDATIDAPGTDLPHVPLLVAAAAPRMLTLAARYADTIALGVPVHTDAADTARRIDLLDTRLPEARPRPELNLNLMAVGDAVPRYLSDRIDPAALAAAGAVSVLTGTPHAMADQLLDRRERLGISYYVVGHELVEAFTPVLRLLSGR